jgi:hypothetical protein
MKREFGAIRTVIIFRQKQKNAVDTKKPLPHCRKCNDAAIKTNERIIKSFVF